MARKNDNEPVPGAGPTFEQALARLETLVGEMENGRMGLDDLLTRFEEGQALVRTCTRRLNEVERKIEMLVKQADQTVKVEPFEPAPGATEAPAEPPPF